MTALGLFLRAYWKPLCIIGLAIAAFSILEWWGHSKDQQGYKRAKVEAAAELQKWREHEKEVDAEVQREYWSQMDTLRTQADRLRAGRSIRCVLGNSNQVRDAKHSGGTPESPTGEPALHDTGDIRGTIVSQGERCEALRQQLIAIKSWQDQLSHQSRNNR
jgi:hypothetical protein